MSQNSETTNKETFGAKFDQGKPCIFQAIISDFPRAVETVAALSDFGAAKYSRHNWWKVSDGVSRYSDAMVRHLVKEGKGEVLDDESGFHHAASVAWNALARLELMLREEEKNGSRA